MQKHIITHEMHVYVSDFDILKQKKKWNINENPFSDIKDRRSI